MISRGGLLFSGHSVHCTLCLRKKTQHYRS